MIHTTISNKFFFKHLYYSQHVPLNSNSASPLIMSMNNSEPERRRNNEEETKLTREEEPIHKELAQLCLSGSDDGELDMC